MTRNTNSTENTDTQNEHDNTIRLFDAKGSDIKETISELRDRTNDYPPEMIIVDEEDLDDLVAAFGGPKNKPDETTVFSEDEYTRHSMEFNLIAFGFRHPIIDDDEYGAVTQINMPTQGHETVLDLRKEHGGFSDTMQGL